MASANNQFKSHDDARRARELDEARKAGLAPAAVDEEGRAINPHIPGYMKDAPWYLGSSAPSLKHQKDWREGGSAGPGGGLSSSASLSAAAAAAKKAAALPKRGDKVFQATTFRKGACENCGAMTHKARDCLERPRARKAKLTGKHIAPDEAIVLPASSAAAAGPSSSSFAAVAAALTPSSTSAHLVGVSRRTFDGKHDRWEGYDPAEHDRVVELFEKVERAKEEAKRAAELERRFRKKKKKEKKTKEKGEGEEGGSSDSDSDSDGSSSDEEDEPEAAAAAAGDPNAAAGDDNKEKLGDDADAAFSKLEKRVRAPGGGASGSVRNLRIREDTAKYLLNLDPESAYFDPKSRSMRGDPTPHVPAEKKAFAGDGAFVRPGGGGAGGGGAAGTAGATPSDYQAWASLQAHAANAAAAGTVVDVAAAPSAAEALAREYARRRAASDAATRAKVLDKYGDGGASVITLGGGGGPSSSSGAAAAAAAAASGRPTSEEEAKRLLYGASERYVEYSKTTGKPIPHASSAAAAAAAAAALAAGGGSAAAAAAAAAILSSSSAAMPRSTLYEEDVFPGNHSSVWGSWWCPRTRAWGYACCHSATKNAYCLGEAGKRAAAAAREQLEANMRSLEEKKKHQEGAAGAGAGAAVGASGAGKTATSSASLLHQRQQKQSLGASIGAGLFADDSGASALDVGELDETKLRAALAAEDARKKRERERQEEEEEGEEERRRKRSKDKEKKKKKKRSSSSSSDSEDDDDGGQGGDDRRRRPASDVNPSSASGLTAEELEAYRLRRERADDPMQQQKGGKGKGGGDGYDLV